MVNTILTASIAFILLFSPAVDVTKRAETEGLAATMTQKARNSDLVLFRAGEVDPLAGLPGEEEYGLTGWREDAGGPLLAVVQFDHTPTANDRGMLTSLDVETLYYLPNNAYIIRAELSLINKLEAITGVRSVFELPKWAKIDPLVMENPDERVAVEIIAAPGRDGQAIFKYLEGNFAEAEFLTSSYHHENGRVIVEISSDIKMKFLDTCSGLEDVLSIMPHLEKQLLNDDSIWVGQSYDTTNTTNYATTATIWNHGISGQGQIVCVNDSGLDSDMCYFRYDATPGSKTTEQFLTPPDIGVLMDGTGGNPFNKVLAYYVEPGADEWDHAGASYHGTHVAGSVLGDNFAALSNPNPVTGHNNGDGMAPNAQLVMQDVGDSGAGLGGLAGDLTDMFQQAYDAGARIHSDSWGTTASVYDATALDMDEFMFTHEDFLFVVAMGNSGVSQGDGTIGSPATAKSIVSVGGTTNGGAASQADDLMDYSRGPVDDGRLKPDVCSPGSSINSASGTTDNTDNNCSPKGMSGTSMATPTTSGYLALLRQYYTDGFYPTGATVTADAKVPSGALMKATIVNGAMEMTGSDYVGGSVTRIPSMDQGWGRTHLDNALYFTGDQRQLRVWDVWNANGIQTGQQREYQVDVQSNSQPLKIHLVWSDPESTTLAATNLVNNLDLEVVAPGGGTTYLGNDFSAGQSTTGGSADLLNPIEGFVLNSPATGTWTIRVKGTAVPGTGTQPYSDVQGYAVVATFAACATAPSAPTLLTATDNTTTGIDLAWNSVSGATGYLIYRAPGGSPTPGEFNLVATTTLTTFTDTFVQGGYTYTYVVRATDNCGESPPSNEASAEYTGNCTLLPDFDGLVSAVNDTASALCDLVLSWNPAVSNCPSGAVITYNIYRDTTPYFTPGPGTLLTSTTSTNYTDYFVNAMTTYYYIVRAEDSTTLNGGINNGGNEETNTLMIKGTPWSATTIPGTFTDDGGDTNAKLLLDGEWIVTNQQNHTGGGQFSYHNALDGMTHSAGQCIAATSPPLDLQAGTSPVLSYWVNYNVEEDWDGVVVEITTNGGGVWTPITPNETYPGDFSQTGSPPGNACAYPSTQGCFNGPAGNAALTGWSQYTHDLSAYQGQTVQVRWNFSSDGGAEFEGFYLDDIEVTFASVNEACATSNGSVDLDRAFYNCNGDTINITVGDSDLLGNGTQNVVIDSTTEGGGETVTLTENPPNTGNFIGSIQTTGIAPAADGLLSLSDGDTITVTYIDADDGLGGFNVSKTDTASADCVLPVISNVQIVDITTSSARVIWDTSEPADSMVTYDTSTPPGTNEYDGSFVTSHSIALLGLTECTKYYLFVTSTDTALNTTTDTNGGSYYNFTTYMVMSLFSDDMESGDGQWTAENPWAISDEASHSSTHAFSDSPGGDYGTSIDLELTSIPFDLSGLAEADLTFWHTYETESGYDYCHVEISTNGSTWDELVEYDGTQAAWTQESFDLAAYLGNPSVQIRFRITSDTSNEGDGWHVDDVLVSYSIPCVGPMLEYDSHIIDDSLGNGDGFPNPGETITLPVTLENIGADPATGVSGTLSETSAYVTMDDDAATYPDIAVSATGETLPDHYTFTIDPTAPDGHVIPFTVNWSADGGYSELADFNITVVAPTLSYDSTIVDDSVGGNGNGRLDAGETAFLQVTLANTGGCGATGISATLSEDSAHVTVNDTTATWPDIGSSTTALSQAPHFDIAVDGGAPTGHAVNFHLDITASGGYTFTGDFTLVVGSMGQVLVIDDTSGGSSVTIATTLRALAYVVTEETEAGTNPATWPGYDFIVHASGSNATSIGTLVDDLVTYVNGGGKLFLEGGEVIYDHYTADPAFASDVMYCDDWNHDSSGDLTLSVPGHPLATTPNALPATIGHTYTTVGDQDAGPALSDATAVYTWTTYPTDAGIIVYDDDANPDNGGQIVFCSFDMDDTANGSSEQDNLIENIAYWLMHYGAQPYLLKYDSNLYTDSCPSGGAGDNDTVIDAGETVDILVTLQSKGTDTVTGITGTLSLSTPVAGVTITQNLASYPDITSGGTGQSLTAYSVHVADSVACGTDITFALALNANEGNWNEDPVFTLTVGDVTPGGEIELLNETFDVGITPPALPTNWTVESSSGNDWVTYAGYTCSSPNVLNYPYNSSEPANSWVFTPELDLGTGITYTLSFNERVASAYFPEEMSVYVGTAAASGSMTIEILPVATYSNTTCNLLEPTFTVPSNGTYYIGFHCTSDADMFRMVMDDVVVKYTASGGCTMNTCSGASPPAEISGSGAKFPLMITKDSVNCPATGYCLTFEAGATATGYNLYEGSIDTFYSHDGAPGNDCNATVEAVVGEPEKRRYSLDPAAGNSYYIISGFNANGEGTAGSGGRDAGLSCAP